MGEGAVNPSEDARGKPPTHGQRSDQPEYCATTGSCKVRESVSKQTSCATHRAKAWQFLKHLVWHGRCEDKIEEAACAGAHGKRQDKTEG